MNNVQNSRRQFQQLLAISILAPLAGCATMRDQDTLIRVSKDKFHAFWREIGMSEELTKILAEHKVKFVELHLDPDAGYVQIGRAIYAVARSGADVRKIVGVGAGAGGDQ